MIVTLDIGSWVPVTVDNYLRTGSILDNVTQGYVID